MAEARAIFKMIDTDGDGTLSPLELSSKLSDFGISDEEIQSLFMLLDSDGDGEVAAHGLHVERRQPPAASRLTPRGPTDRSISTSSLPATAPISAPPGSSRRPGRRRPPVRS